MSKIFNTAANCIPQKHYMVDLTGRLEQIKVMVDRGDYFTINRARQYGKTTTLMALAEYLKKDYLVVSLDFQELDESDWQSIAYQRRGKLLYRITNPQHGEDRHHH